MVFGSRRLAATLLVALVIVDAAFVASATSNILRMAAIVSSTGSLGNTMDQAKHGYNLFKQELNAAGGFKITDSLGREFPVTVSMDVYDDESSVPTHTNKLNTGKAGGTILSAAGANAAARLVDGKAHVLFGGHPTFFETNTAASQSSSTVNVQCCVGPDSLYALGRDHVFGVQASNGLYPKDFILNVALDGAKKIALVHFSGNAFTRTTCESAESLAKANGMEVIRNLAYADNQAPYTQVKEAAANISASGAEVLVACTLDGDGKNLEIELQRLGFRPKAKFYTVSPTKQDYAANLEKDGAKAEFAFSCGQWDVGQDLNQDWLFGRNADYSKKYKALTGDIPTYVAAGASAAGLVVVEALKKAYDGCNFNDLSTLTVDKLFFDPTAISCTTGSSDGYERFRAAMVKVKTETIFGNVEFNVNRRNIAKATVTTQWVHKDAEQYTQRDFSLPAKRVVSDLIIAPVLPRVAGGRRLIYPAQLDSACGPGNAVVESGYDCRACQPGTLQSQGGQTSCFKAPVGFYPNADRTVALECPKMSSTTSEGAVDVSGCSFCKSGSYRANSNSPIECVPCPVGSSCPNTGTTIKTLPIDRGYFRFSADVAEVYKCPDADLCKDGKTCACQGSSLVLANGATNGDSICGAHSKGPLCMLCEDKYYRKSTAFTADGTGCESCEDNEEAVGAVSGFIFIILAFIVLIFLAGRHLLIASRPLFVWCGLSATHDRLCSGDVRISFVWWRLILIQLWYMLQTMSRFVNSQKVNFPEPFSTFIGLVQVINLDLSFIPSMKCVVTFTLFDVMLGWTMIPLGAAVIGFVRIVYLKIRTSYNLNGMNSRSKAYASASEKEKREIIERQLVHDSDNVISSVVLVWCLFHSTVCSNLIDFFICDPDLDADGYAVGPGKRDKFMRKDYSISCKSSEYNRWVPFASFFLLFYYVLFPIGLLGYIYNERFRRKHAVSSGGAGYGGALQFLTRHLRTKYWWYEILALEVRVIISGLLYPVVTHPGLHMTVVLIVTVAFYALTRDMNPYLNSGHQTILNNILFAEMTTVLFGMIINSKFLKASGEFAISIMTFTVAMLVFAFTVYAYRNERINRLMTSIEQRMAILKIDFDTLYKGMNVAPLDEMILTTAETIMRRGSEFACGLSTDDFSEDDDARAWTYLREVLLPLHQVWDKPVSYQKIFTRYSGDLDENAQMLVRRATRDEQLSYAEFDKRIRALMGDVLYGFLSLDDKREAFDDLAIRNSDDVSSLSIEKFPEAVKVIVQLVGGRNRDLSSVTVTDVNNSASTQYVYLAGLGHLLNERILDRMSAASAAHLSRDDWGQRLINLKPFDHGVFQDEIKKKEWAKAAQSFKTQSLKSKVDAHVMPNLLHQMAVELNPIFKDELMTCLGKVTSGACELKARFSVKKVARMVIKVLEYRDESKGESDDDEFFSARISDALRATVVCPTSRDMVESYDAITGETGGLFARVLRLKNKLAEVKKPYNLHVNLEFKPPNQPPMTVEIQFMHENLFSMANGSHHLYELCRAMSISDYFGQGARRTQKTSHDSDNGEGNKDIAKTSNLPTLAA